MSNYIFLFCFIAMVCFGLYSLFKDVGNANYTSENFNHELKSFPEAYSVASEIYLVGDLDADAKKLLILLGSKYSKTPTLHFCKFLISEVQGVSK